MRAMRRPIYIGISILAALIIFTMLPYDAQRFIAQAFMALALGAFGFCVYFAPWLNAKNRKHRNSAAIFVVNFFFGWTVIGWVAALVWSLTNEPKRFNSASPARIP
jgi:hypothetical protein